MILRYLILLLLNKQIKSPGLIPGLFLYINLLNLTEPYKLAKIQDNF